MNKIALFPLKNVLFPDSIMPVHVFEERYKILINQKLQNEIAFGINLKDAGEIHQVGCTCSIHRIMKHYEDGSMDILIKGEDRYSIITKKMSDIGYLVADIDYSYDINDSLNNELKENCITLYNEMVDKVKNLNLNKFEFNIENSKNISYKIAQKSGLTLKQKYELLSLLNENDRLRFLQKHLEKIFPIVEEAEFIHKIVKNDGYYQPNNL